MDLLLLSLNHHFDSCPVIHIKLLQQAHSFTHRPAPVPQAASSLSSFFTKFTLSFRKEQRKNMRPQTISLMGIILPIITFGSLSQATWNLTAKNNVMLYWGQNGVANFDAKAGQKPLLHFCQDPNVDVCNVHTLKLS